MSEFVLADDRVRNVPWVACFVRMTVINLPGDILYILGINFGVVNIDSYHV